MRWSEVMAQQKFIQQQKGEVRDMLDMVGNHFEWRRRVEGETGATEIERNPKEMAEFHT